MHVLLGTATILAAGWIALSAFTVIRKRAASPYRQRARQARRQGQ